jgi:hypothetical protein
MDRKICRDEELALDQNWKGRKRKKETKMRKKVFAFKGTKTE